MLGGGYRRYGSSKTFHVKVMKHFGKRKEVLKYGSLLKGGSRKKSKVTDWKTI